MNDEGEPQIIDLAKVMADDTPMNRAFHVKYDQWRNAALAPDADRFPIIKLTAYFFYLQGQAHAGKWTKP